MKIRIKGNSIRLRLSKSEVSLLGDQKEIYDSCQFGNTVFSYGVSISEHGEFSAQLEGTKATVFLPEGEIANWDKNDKISITKTLPDGLIILVEKDFKCLINRAHEQEDDMYENPASDNFV